MRLVLYVDGASRGNPGAASIGASLQKPNGDEVDSISEAIGITTNNEAEYRALVAGLTRAIEMGCTEIEVRADSQLIVRQVLGQYKVKHPNLKEFWREAQALKGRFKRFAIHHVPREENTRADELANQALDR
jgi:ribonuclease HI